MTGRDLIVYILTNSLEDELIFEDGKFIGHITVGEAAVKMDVGISTVHTFIDQNLIDCIIIGETVFIPADFASPIEEVVKDTNIIKMEEN